MVQLPFPGSGLPPTLRCPQANSYRCLEGGPGLALFETREVRHRITCIVCSPGSIKGDVKRKHFSVGWRTGSSLTSSPWGFGRVTEIRSCLTVVTSALRRPWVLKLRKPDGGHWPTMVLSETRAERGTMAWLGYPREHMVPRETWRPCARSLTRPGYLPSNPSPQNPSTRVEVTPV